MSREINNPLILSDFLYELPIERIAQYPVSPRDHSRLLCYNKCEISHHRFYQLPDLLPKGSMLVFNQTKVIPARLFFQRETGARIEVLLIEPHRPPLPAQALQTTDACVWKCMIGNKKKWKVSETLTHSWSIEGISCKLNATWLDREADLIQFSWEPGDRSFGSLINSMGTPPLPPYLKRDPVEEDKIRYQTVYAKEEGAVAAPTAGLHFTEKLMEKLATKNISQVFINLHVGIGTFAPIKTEQVENHDMHSEKLSISLEVLRQLTARKAPIIAVGTTSMRLLESLYWLGVKASLDVMPFGQQKPFLSQKEPYQYAADTNIDRDAALQHLMAWMEAHQLEILQGSTSLYIMPGYKFRVCDGLITNYHQPGSTLILLVAAFTGTDWRKIYHEALKNDYRFLSYGDSSLLLP